MDAGTSFRRPVPAWTQWLGEARYDSNRDSNAAPMRVDPGILTTGPIRPQWTLADAQHGPCNQTVAIDPCLVGPQEGLSDELGDRLPDDP